MVTIGSLFAGIGGLELGLEAALDGRVVWQVEIEKYPRSQLARHWPEADRSVTDVRDAGRDTLEPVDLICGGFPCQDISLAGTGSGLEGKRSGLWFEYLRVVRELRPRFVVVENVPALAVRGLGVVLGGLASLGYDAEWSVLSAADVGAPHLRRRLFIVAWLADSDGDRLREQPKRGQQARRNDPERCDADPATVGRNAEPVDAGGTVADSDGGGREVERVEGRQPGHGGPPRNVADRRDRARSAVVDHRFPPPPDDREAWALIEADAQPAVCRSAPGLSRRVARLKALGNAVVPQVAYEVGLRVRELLG